MQQTSLSLKERIMENLDLIVKFTNPIAYQSNHCIVIIDHVNKKILHFSESTGLWYIPKLEVGQKFFINPYWNYIDEADKKAVSEADRRACSFFDKSSIEERLDYSFSYDCHLLLGSHKRLTNHIFVPMTLTDEGNLELGLFMISFSPQKESGHAVINNGKKNVTYKYLSLKKDWGEGDKFFLTETEKEIILLSAQGLTMKEIAQKTFKSPETIKSIKKSIFKKLDTSNITAAVINALYRKYL
jgi:DNA-binding CsgD family transcriptional regulator